MLTRETFMADPRSPGSHSPDPYAAAPEEGGGGAPKRKGRCPVCGKPLAEAFKPFCSKRCADVDLNRWLAGVYRIETREAPEEAELPPPAPADDEG